MEEETNRDKNEKENACVVARWLTVGSVFSLEPKNKEEIIRASKAMPRDPCFLPNADVKAVVDREDFVNTVYNKDAYSDPPKITFLEDPSSRDYYNEDFELLEAEEFREEAKHVGRTYYGLNMATLSILGRVGLMGSQKTLLPRHNCQPRRLNCRNVSSRLEELCPSPNDEFKAGMIGTYLGLSKNDSENESRMTIIPLRVSCDRREKKCPKHPLALVAIDSPEDAGEDLLGDLFGELADNECLRNLFQIVCDKPLKEVFKDTYQEPEQCTGSVEDACKQLDLTYQVLSSFYSRFNGFQKAQDLCDLVVRCFHCRTTSTNLEDLRCFSSWSELSYMATLMLTEREVVFPGVIAGLARLYAAKSAMLGLVPMKTLEQAGIPDSSQERVDEQYLIKAEAPTILNRKILLHVVMPVGKNMELKGSVCDQVEHFSASEQRKALRDRERTVADFCANLVQDPSWKRDGKVQHSIWQIEGPGFTNVYGEESTMILKDFNTWCLGRRQHCFEKLKDYPDIGIFHAFIGNNSKKWAQLSTTPWTLRHYPTAYMQTKLLFLLYRAATVIGLQEVEGLPLVISPARSYLKLARANPQLAPGWQQFLLKKQNAGFSGTHYCISLRVKNFHLFIPETRHASLDPNSREVTMMEEKSSLPNEEQKEQQQSFDKDQVDLYFPQNADQSDRCAELQRGVIHTAGMIVAAGLMITFSEKGQFGGQKDLFMEHLRSWADSLVHELCTDYGIVMPPPLNMTQELFPRLSWILTPHITRVGKSGDMFCTNLYGWAFLVVFLLEEDKDMSACEVQYKLDEDYKGVLENSKVFPGASRNRSRLRFNPKAFCKLCPQIVKVVNKADGGLETSTPITLKSLVDEMVIGGSDPLNLLMYVEARLGCVPILWLVSQFGRFTVLIPELVQRTLDFRDSTPDVTSPCEKTPTHPEKKNSSRIRGKNPSAPRPASSRGKKRTSPRKKGSLRTAQSPKKKKRKKEEELVTDGSDEDPSEPEPTSEDDEESESGTKDSPPPKTSPKRKQLPLPTTVAPNHNKRNSDLREDGHLAPEGKTNEEGYGGDGGKSLTQETTEKVASDLLDLRKISAERAAEKRVWVPSSQSEATEFQFSWTDPLDFKDDFATEVNEHLKTMCLSYCEVTLRDVIRKGDCGYYCLLLGLRELEADNRLLAACQDSALPLRKELAYHAFGDANGFKGNFDEGKIAVLLKNETIRKFLCPCLTGDAVEIMKEYQSYRHRLETRSAGLKARLELSHEISSLEKNEMKEKPSQEQTFLKQVQSTKNLSDKIFGEKALQQMEKEAREQENGAEKKSPITTDTLVAFCHLHCPGWTYESEFHQEYSEDSMSLQLGPILFASRYKCQVVVYHLRNKALKNVYTADGRGSEFIYKGEDADSLNRSLNGFPVKDPHNRTVYLCYADVNEEGAGPMLGHFTFIQRQYHEEHAHLYPITESVPPPPELVPEISEKWDESSRVLKYNTSKPEKQRLSHLYARNDLTVILTNVFDVKEREEESWHQSSILLRHESKYFCEFSVQDYKDGLHREVEKDPSFTPNLFWEHLEAYKAGGPAKSIYYMKDVPLQQMAPDMYDDFLKILTFKDSLPGGSFCMLKGVPFTTRPFMGPSLYTGPPGPHTHLHQDGLGSVDSAHLCISGYNEVVILRRLPEQHKRNAISLLFDLKEEDDTFVIGLMYGEPHDNLKQNRERPGWPTNEGIERCRKKGYCPSVFILGPGELVHINKGRLHAFRKMSHEILPKSDCHFGLRKKKLEELEGKESHDLVCVSVAWDWMFHGNTPRTLNRELSTSLLAGRCCRKLKKACLGIPETSLLRLSQICSSHFVSPTEASKDLKQPKKSDAYSRRHIQALGIQPSIDYWFQRQSSYLIPQSPSNESGSKNRKGAPILDSLTPEIDEYGNEGWSCACCSVELSNLYYHCIACEKSSGKDFNVCYDCHENGEAKKSRRVHTHLPLYCSLYNHHIGESPNCGCNPRDNTCNACRKCTHCSCICHLSFELHSRFLGADDIQLLKKAVESVSLGDEPKTALEVNAYLPDAIEQLDKLAWNM